MNKISLIIGCSIAAIGAILLLSFHDSILTLLGIIICWFGFFMAWLGFETKRPERRRNN